MREPHVGTLRDRLANLPLRGHRVALPQRHDTERVARGLLEKLLDAGVRMGHISRRVRAVSF